MSDDDPILEMRHCRGLGYCVHGLRRYCDLHGLDFKKLARNEMPVSEFAESGQHHGKLALDYVHAEVKRGR
jgi:hypothetical protein